MKQVFISGYLLFVLGFMPALAHAQAPDQNGFSMGVVLGDPTGITLRGGLGSNNAIQVHLGFSPFPGDAVTTMVDWTHDAYNFLRDNPNAALLFYFGFGGKAEWFTGNYYAYSDRHRWSDNSNLGLGVRGLAGLRSSFFKTPVDIFLELAPIGLIFVTPDDGVYYDIDLALGCRYRF